MKKARRSRRPPHAEGGKAADKFVDTVHMATYAEYNYFSERNFLWRRYRTKSPRMPTEKDRLTKWTNTLFQPALLNTFFGTENKKVNSSDSMMSPLSYIERCRSSTLSLCLRTASKLPVCFLLFLFLRDPQGQGRHLSFRCDIALAAVYVF